MKRYKDFLNESKTEDIINHITHICDVFCGTYNIGIKTNSLNKSYNISTDFEFQDGIEYSVINDIIYSDNPGYMSFKNTWAIEEVLGFICYCLLANYFSVWDKTKLNERSLIYLPDNIVESIINKEPQWLEEIEKVLLNDFIPYRKGPVSEEIKDYISPEMKNKYQYIFKNELF